MITTILKAADEKKAFDIKLLDIKKLTTITDYFLICSGNSERQVKAIAKGIEEKMYKLGYILKNKEGHNVGRWILLDFGEIVAHIFYKEDREFYNLERLWVDAEDIDVDKFITYN
ncbi:MAG: ribosome silencing factor [Firmicutes bacterium]|nr:ribosome silencing factor [Bacillota bacterium]